MTSRVRVRGEKAKDQRDEVFNSLRAIEEDGQVTYRQQMERWKVAVSLISPLGSVSSVDPHPVAALRWIRR